MGTQNNSATRVTTIYELATMSHLVAFLMLLSLLLVGVNTMPQHNPQECFRGQMVNWQTGICEDVKREALDTPMAHKTKRGRSCHNCILSCLNMNTCMQFCYEECGPRRSVN